MRQRLLASAAKVMAEVGLKHASIDDYIQAAGVSRGTFYNYYRTREQLMDDVWRSVGRDPFEEIRRTCAAIDHPARRIAAWCRLVLTTAEENAAWGWVVYAFSIDATVISKDMLAFPRPDLYSGHSLGIFQFDDIDCATSIVVSSIRATLRDVLTGAKTSGSASELARMLLLALGSTREEAREIAYGSEEAGGERPIVGSGTAISSGDVNMTAPERYGTGGA